MQQHSLLQALRVCAWVSRFLTNSRNLKPRGVKGPLTTDEMKYQETRRAQEEGRSLKNFEADKLQLNLQPDNNGILECRGRIVGAYPIYLPDGNAFTHKLVQQAHLATLHGGVTLTMTKVRETHWIPRLRKLTKKVIKSCWGCKRFRAQAYQSPPLGNLPTTRTQGVTPYETIGVDFAGPIKYQVTKKMQGWLLRPDPIGQGGMRQSQQDCIADATFCYDFKWLSLVLNCDSTWTLWTMESLNYVICSLRLFFVFKLFSVLRLKQFPLFTCTSLS